MILIASSPIESKDIVRGLWAPAFLPVVSLPVPPREVHKKVGQKKVDIANEKQASAKSQ